MGKKPTCTKCNAFIAKNLKALSAHTRQCNGVPKSKIGLCEFCNRNYDSKNFERHRVNCHKKKFFDTYGTFLNFLYKLVILYNLQNEKNNLLRFTNEKKYFIYNKKIENKNEKEKKEELKELKNNTNYISDNIPILNKYYKDENEDNKKLLEELGVEKEKRKNLMLVKLIKTIKASENINLSFRQIVFDFLNNISNSVGSLVNNKIIEKINKKYKKNDFFTYDEIKNISDELYYKVFYLIDANSEYRKKYDYYYNFLEEFKNGNNKKYLCVFCKKYYLHKYQHYRKCIILKNEYKESVSETFYKFIINNFTDEQLEKIVPENILKNYISKDFLYFINNIKDNIEHPAEFNNLNNNKFSYVFKKKYMLKNENLEKFLFFIYIEIEKLYDIKLNFRQKRFIREESIDYFLKTGELNKSNIIKKFKNNYNEEENKNKLINTNENIINKILIINNINKENNEENNEENNKENKIKLNKEGEVILCDKSDESKDEEDEEEENEEDDEENEEDDEENEEDEESIKEENKKLLTELMHLHKKRKIINKYNYNIKYIKNFNNFNNIKK